MNLSQCLFEKVAHLKCSSGIIHSWLYMEQIQNNFILEK